MSIIIAKIEGNSCLFRLDTKVSILNGDESVTGDNKLRLPPEEGVLKIHILHQNICVAFAGTVKICCEIINRLCNKPANDKKDIFEFIQAELIQSSDDSEFIVAFLNKNRIPRLFRVDKDVIEEGNSFWIGNKDAFAEFQSYFINSDSKKSIIDRTIYSFREMIRNSKIDTIGDFVIEAYFNQPSDSFVYEEALESISGYGIIEAKANVKTTLSEGTVNEGAFIVSNLVSNRTNKPAICLFFEKGNLAFLYLPLSKTNINANPIVIENKSINELKMFVLEKFGIELFGLSMNLGQFKIVK